MFSARNVPPRVVARLWKQREYRCWAGKEHTHPDNPCPVAMQDSGLCWVCNIVTPPTAAAGVRYCGDMEAILKPLNGGVTLLSSGFIFKSFWISNNSKSPKGWIYIAVLIPPLPHPPGFPPQGVSFISFRCIQCTYRSSYVHGFSFFPNVSIFYRLFNTMSYIKSLHDLF